MKGIRKMRLTFGFLFVISASDAFSQGYIEGGFIPNRNFQDDNKNKLGSASEWQVSGKYTIPFSVKVNEKGQPIVWAGTVSGQYVKMNNHDGACEVNPDGVLNLSFNVSHRRPLSERWYMLASLGAGIYSAPNEIALRSVLANGGIIFAYKLRDNLDIGLGAGLTNSYGVPLIMPIGYLKWTTTGRYEIDVEAVNSMKASVKRNFSDRFSLSLVPFDMSGLSSVVRRDGKTKVYGVMRMRSYIRPEWKLGKSTSIYLNAGMESFHSVRLSDRSVKGFKDTFSSKEKWRFSKGFYMAVGLSLHPFKQ